MKKTFAVMFAMLFAASTGVYAAKHMEGEKGAKAATKAEATKDAKGGKAEAKKDEKAKK